MDIFKIGRLPQIHSIQDIKQRDTHKSSDRDADRNGDQSQGGANEEPATKDEAKKAAEKLEKSPHFQSNALSVEVRESDTRYFLDIFDPEKRKIKSIGGVGIRAIINSYNGDNSGRGSRILDRKI